MNLSRWSLMSRSARPHFICYKFVTLLLLVAICLCAPGLPSTRAQGTVRKIREVQGSGPTSPFAGQPVMTSGIVTAIKGDGFFIQEPDATADADPKTSEAIFVFTSSAPPETVAVGNAVMVAGTVSEFKPTADTLSLPRTEIAGSPTVTLLGTGNALPTPLTITANDASPTGPVDQLERFEAMRVRVATLRVVGPTGGTIDEHNATATSDGVFWGVVGSLISRPFREPGIDARALPPASAPAGVPRFDTNSERIRIDSTGQRDRVALDIGAGLDLFNVVGVLDYQARAYTILPDAEFSVTSRSFPVPLLPPSLLEFTVASFNLDRFYDTTDDPGTNDAVLTPEAFDRRLNKAVLALSFLSQPDIIGVQEVENLATLEALAAKINSFGSGRGQPNPDYIAALVEGNDAEGLDVGFLVKRSRVTIEGVTQLGKDAVFTNPANGQQEIVNDHPPLRLKAVVTSLLGSSLPVTVIVNHLRALDGIDDASEGARVRAKRRAQAEFLADLLQTEQSAADANLIVVGDFNAFEFNDGYVDVMGTIKGTPAPADRVVLASPDLVNPDFIDITTDRVAPAVRYSTVANGNAQALDHILVNQSFLAHTGQVLYAHGNADAPESSRNNGSIPARLSDHDVAVAYFNLLPTGSDLTLANVGTPDAVKTGGQITYTITATNQGTSVAPAVNLTDLVGLDGTTFVSVTSTQGTCSPPSLGDRGAVGCRLGELGPGASARVTLVVRAGLNVQFPFQITNTALAVALIDGRFNQVSATATNTLLPSPIIVSASVSGKRLSVDGLNFAEAAVIEVNGKPKPTKPGEFPSLTLVAKKGGKKIAPGDTVTLMVVNPDGSRSAPFPFTRPAA